MPLFKAAGRRCTAAASSRKPCSRRGSSVQSCETRRDKCKRTHFAADPSGHRVVLNVGPRPAVCASDFEARRSSSSTSGFSSSSQSSTNSSSSSSWTWSHGTSGGAGAYSSSSWTDGERVAAFAAAGALVCVAALGSVAQAKDVSRERGPAAVASMLQYPANRPIEDRTHMERLANGAWWFSVFDGHGGWQCSDYASKNLHVNVEHAISNHLGESPGGSESYEGHIDRRLVTRALKSAFERTDRQYMVKVFGAFELGFGRDTRAGSCALGTLVIDGMLFVANAGDSRAVLAVNRESFELSTSGAGAQLHKRTASRGGQQQSAEAEVDMHDWNIEELLGAAAVRDSIGEDLSPAMAEALRAKLLNQIYEMRKSGKADDDDQLPTEISREALSREAASILKSHQQRAGERPAHAPSGAEKTTPESSGNAVGNNGSGNTSHQHASSQHQVAGQSTAGGSSRFVNAVRLLTGGKNSGAEEVPESAAQDSRFVALDMSNDHNCREVHERELLERAHPNEKDVVVCRVNNPDQCYIKGKLQPTRAFGDFYLKYAEFMRGAEEDAAAGRYVPPPYTPPYITATPEVQVRTLRKGVDEFLIMATDGLWDLVSSQEAVDIAGRELRRPGGTSESAGEELIEEALRRAARNAGQSVAQLKALKMGRARRSKHDDISVIVIDLARLVEMHYWG
mmetsp:Transcript_1364/g.2409  ORF Transcript_1364/g.2409 Transcript_1364/m.2409 type:complete len:682 (-) Transcript_1364:490-2535(-)|eukprot:CAMPEP_0171501572 /NCGR_PEP_ID=MMETSP0958-20121227/9636_1 /TAXON_ID=87120 /ORGANISM="Aurantiochytrium limacinum, Strain ATCCMYA-1381" /LENGTH=681 /DNA_ID=CAMNT_0012036409 /DNA_START=554 /DNA_END=2599 /DNA_ORIENTATION=+